MKPKKKINIDSRTVDVHDPMKEIREAIKATSYSDPMKEFRESLESTTLRNPIREYQEAMKAATYHDPLKEYKEAMKIASFNDPMKEIREAMKATAYSDPMKEVREAMKVAAFSDPMKEIREAMKATAYSDPMKEVREAMKMTAFSDPMKQAREAMKVAAFSDPMKEIREAMKMTAYNDPMKQAREAMKVAAFSDPMKEIREAMKATAYSDPMKEVREAMKATAYSNPMKGIREAMNVMTSATNHSPLIELKRNLETLSLANFSEILNPVNWPETDQSELNIVVKENSVVIDQESFGLDEINKQLENLSLHFQKNLTTNFEEAVVKIITEIQSQENTTLQKLLIYIVYPFIIALSLSLINPVTDHYIKDYLKSDKEKRELPTTESESNSLNELSDLRIVTCQILNVREKPNSASRKIGILNLGSIIKTIRKEGNWILMKRTDQELDTDIQGWVSTRYTKKIE